MKRFLLFILAGTIIMGCTDKKKEATAESLRATPWQEIAPEEIDLNAVKMADQD